MAHNGHAIAGHFVYSAYGEVKTWGGSAPETDGPLFAGYFFDAETCLYLARNRYYNSSTATWINRDPIGYKGGMNLYEYCGDNPVIRTDSNGLDYYVCKRPIGPGGDSCDAIGRKCGGHTAIFSDDGGMLYDGWSGGKAVSGASGLPGKPWYGCKKMFRQNDDHNGYDFCAVRVPRKMKWGPKAGMGCSNVTSADITACLRARKGPEGDPGVFSNCQTDTYNALADCCMGGFIPGL